MKKVAIIGSCVSRDIFNDVRMQGLCEVDFYSFQNNVWDMVNEPLNVPATIINSLPFENFIRRMVDYDLNKTAIKILEEKKDDYLVIDLYAMRQSVVKVFNEEKEAYAYTYKSQDLFRMLNNTKMDFDVELINRDDIEQEVIERGFEKFAKWAIKNFNPNNIIIHYPLFCEKYYNIDGEIIGYTKEKSQEFEMFKKYIYYWTDFLVSKIDGCKVFRPKLKHKAIAKIRITDPINQPVIPVHYTNEDANSIVSQFIDLLDLKLQNNINEFDLLAQDCLKMSNLASKLNDKINMTNSAIITNLNYFVASRINYDECVVFVVSKNQAADKLHKFFNKNKMGLNLNIVKSQSYVGVVDKSAQFVFEEASYEKVSYQYDFGGNKVELVSDYKTNANSIMINGKEFSQNRRGLNFVVFNKKLNKVEHAFVCDTYADDLMLIRL